MREKNKQYITRPLDGFLKIDQNNDGSFTVEWDKQDPEWKWMNNLTSKEIQVMIEQAVKLDNEQRL